MGKRRDEPRFDIRFDGLERMRPETRVGMAIIHQAMLDWHLLIDRRAWEQETLARPNFTEIRQFFRSRWCAKICARCELMTPEYMLDILERELAEAQKKPRTGGGGR